MVNVDGDRREDSDEYHLYPVADSVLACQGGSAFLAGEGMLWMQVKPFRA